MRKLALALAASGLPLLLGACAYDSYGGAGYYRSSYSAPYYGARYHYGYYDNFYGPIYSGYWGPGGYFYYSTVVRPQVIVRDHDRHVRRDPAPGHRRVRIEHRRERADNDRRRDLRADRRRHRHRGD